MKSFSPLRNAFVRTIPVLFGYAPIGIAFGFLLVTSGYPWYLALLMSILIYSGATQFLAIGFFLKAASFPEMMLAAVLLNLRHTVFGLSLLKKYEDLSCFKPYAVFALTDETYALVSAMDEPPAGEKGPYYFYLSLFNQSYWVAGTAIGALLGRAAAVSIKGLDFALTALFVVLAVEQCRTPGRLKPAATGLITGLLALVFAPRDSMLLLSMLASAAVLLWGRPWGRNG